MNINILLPTTQQIYSLSKLCFFLNLSTISSTQCLHLLQILVYYKYLQVRRWRPATSGVPQGSVLGLVPFNVFVSNMDSGTDCTLNKTVDDYKLSGLVDMLEERHAFHMDLERLDMWACAKLMKFTNKCFLPNQTTAIFLFTLGKKIYLSLI